MEKAESILDRALEDTRKWILGTLWYQVFVVTITTIAAAATGTILYVFPNLQQWQVFVIIFFIGVGAWALVYLLIFLFFLRRAPGKLRSEAEIKAAKNLISITVFPSGWELHNLVIAWLGSHVYEQNLSIGKPYFIDDRFKIHLSVHAKISSRFSVAAGR